MLSVFKYSKQTFWNNSGSHSPYLSKARGIVLDPAGTIVSHPFDKCFNYLENGTGQDISDSDAVIVTDKLNGFLGIISGHPLKRGALLAHTQGGFSGPFVQYIHDHISRELLGRLLNFFSHTRVTLMFEGIHAEDPHIVEYAVCMQGLHLLGVRGLAESDQAWTEEAVDAVAKELGLRRPSWTRMTFGKARAQLRDCKTEGYMIRRDTPNQEYLLKMKSPYYLTTKFLGRLSQARIKHLFGSPKDFKKTIDEEFYVIVDAIVERSTVEAFLNLEDVNRVVFVRELINQLQ